MFCRFGNRGLFRVMTTQAYGWRTGYSSRHAFGTVACASTVVVGAAAAAQCSSEDEVDKMLQKVKSFIDRQGLPTDTDKLAHRTQEKIQNFLDSGTGGQISWGFMMGYCSGFAFRKISAVGAVVIGMGFMGMQSLSYAGYIKVNYKGLERDMTDAIDLNHDGKLDGKDVKLAYVALMKVLQFSLPAGSGYATGFALGFRRG